MLLPSVFLACVLAASAVALPAQPSPSLASPPPRVSHPYTGVTYQGNLSSDIESFLNIRFAEDTGGPNRFAHPKPFQYPNSTVVNASANGAACPQAKTTGIFGADVTEMSEDCLTLRIDRLQNTTAHSNLPVMIYLFGGGFTSGQIYDPSYKPTGLLKSAAGNGSPIIYAAINYRLNVFGFASTPALAAHHSLNAGLYDQRLGLEWIRDNIHLFGGNPNNITIFGESAGAISVGHQINAFGGSIPVPFHRAIMQSGMSTSVPGTTGDISANHTVVLAQMVNCTSPDSATELECLRSIPLDVLLPVVTKYELSINPNALLIWQPVAPSSFIPDAPSKLLQAGRFAKNIGIINGWNENDGSVFVQPNITTDAEVVQAIAYPAALDQNATNELLSLYPLSAYSAAKSGNNSATAQFFRASQMFRDYQFLCPSLLLEQVMATFSNPAKPKSYLFDMNTTIDTADFERSNMTYLGVAHGSDVPFVFDTVPTLQTATAAQKQLAGAMSASWAAFASSGNVSDGAQTVAGWTEGHRRHGDFEVRIMGGPSAGMTAISSSGQGVLASEDLIRRCAFWNSERVQDQMQK